MATNASSICAKATMSATRARLRCSQRQEGRRSERARTIVDSSSKKESGPHPRSRLLPGACGSMSRGEVSVPPRLAAVAGPSTGATGWSSAAHGSSLMHEEVEFCAEEELVTIVPAFRKDAPLALLSGKYGPFIPQARRPCLSAPRRERACRTAGALDRRTAARTAYGSHTATLRRLYGRCEVGARALRVAKFRRTP
jgi:hypothetical protein